MYHSEPLSAVHEAVRGSETRSAHPPPPSRFRPCTATTIIKQSRPRRSRDVNSVQRSQFFPCRVSDLLFGRVSQLKAVKVWK